MKERQQRCLREESEKKQRVTVLRNSHMQEIPANELVVGDLCSIKIGKKIEINNSNFFSLDDTIPADGLIVQATNLKIDPSSMTGLLINYSSKLNKTHFCFQDHRISKAKMKIQMLNFYQVHRFIKVLLLWLLLLLVLIPK